MNKLPMETAAPPHSLAGQRIAFTGRLASLSHREARELLRRHGAMVTATVSRATSLLVIGQDDWPLLPSGRLTRNLRRARRLIVEGAALAIIEERELLSRLGLIGGDRRFSRRYSLAELCEVAGISGRQARAWMQRGLLQPVASVDSLPSFDFEQLATARLLARLRADDASRRRLRRNLHRLARLLPRQGRLLQALVAQPLDGRLLCRNERGELIDLAGQKHFEFCEEGDRGSLAFAPPEPTADELHERGCEAEAADNWPLAEHCFRRAVAADPANADLHFNLGNVLIAQNRFPDASACYREALRLLPAFAEAWNNLGVALAEMAQLDEACEAFERALRLDPAYADARYNLADALDLAGRASDACNHWREFLGGAEAGPWSNFARLRLAEIEKP